MQWSLWTAEKRDIGKEREAEIQRETYTETDTEADAEKGIKREWELETKIESALRGSAKLSAERQKSCVRNQACEKHAQTLEKSKERKLQLQMSTL